MPCRGPCGLREDGTTNYEWGTPEAGCYFDEHGPEQPHSWAPEYKRQQAADGARRAGNYTVRAQFTFNQMLCSASRALERLGYDFDENPVLAQWWAEHKKKDKANAD